ncbi:MAG: lytic transglycosylase domain-containing protein [Gammaproteobacteria bacterium]|nr:lytic transglycosylase domain-containing protein [Gammaproteobacteria bacterium]
MIRLLLVILALASMQSAGATQTAWRNYMSNDTALQPAMAFPYQSCFERSAVRYRLPVTLLLAVARGESDFDVRARSHANAHGLMQILWPSTARYLGFNRLTELYEPCRNVDAGARYLREMIDRYSGDVHLALAAYNYGPGRIHRDKVIPKGAQWYSAYIHRHLDFVLGRGPTALPADPARSYDTEAKMALITFDAPYRADAFVRQLRSVQPRLRLEWFREESGRFKVMMLYSGSDDLRRSQSLLRDAGFRLRKPRG